MPADAAEHGLLDDRALRHGVVGQKVRRTTMFGVSIGVVIHLVQHPSRWIVGVMADVESPAPPVLSDGFTGVMKQRLFELRPHFRTDRHQNKNDMHGSMLRVGRVLLFGPGFMIRLRPAGPKSKTRPTLPGTTI